MNNLSQLSVQKLTGDVEIPLFWIKFWGYYDEFLCKPVTIPQFKLQACFIATKLVVCSLKISAYFDKGVCTSFR
jgi:hypothetical protein